MNLSDVIKITVGLKQPALPEEIEQNDLVIGALQLGTQVSVYCVFRVLDKSDNTKRDMEGVTLLWKEQGRQVWTEAATDLVNRFGNKLSASTQIRLDGLLRFALLDEKDPMRNKNPAIGSYEADMESLYGLDAKDFDAVYIISPETLTPSLFGTTQQHEAS